MFTVSVMVHEGDAASFHDEFRDWLETSRAVADRIYPEEDGSISIFLDYASETDASNAARELKETWPFESAALVDDGRYVFVFRAAAS